MLFLNLLLQVLQTGLNLFFLLQHARSVAFTRIPCFLVWAVTLTLEYLPRRLKPLAELHDLGKTLGGGVKSLDEDLFLPFMVQHKLDKIDDFVVGEDLVKSK